jgi:diadenosine tetraphosphate (Ap4A) HIT family hydrolase
MSKNTPCIGCALQSGELKRTGCKIGETKNFDVEQDYETPIPGFIIISSKKHIKGIEDLSEKVRKEFIDLVYNVRKAMSTVLGVEYVYLIQKEDTFITRSHFHVWLFPRYDWMNRFGDKIASVTSIIEYARKNMKTDENLTLVKDTALKISSYISTKRKS